MSVAEKITSFSVVDEKREPSNNVFDSIREMHERWNNRLKLETLNIAKDYVAGRIGIILLFDRCTDIGRIINAHRQDANLVVPVLDDKRPSGGRKDHVFVYNVQLVQGMDNLPFPTLIKFETEEEARQISLGCFYSVTRGFVIDPVFPDGQFGITVLSSTVKPSQFPVRNVESRSEIMNSVPDNESEIDWQKLAEVNAKDTFPSFVIFANAKTVRVLLDERSKGLFKVADMVFGPFDL
jgi:hypothetical protein